MPSSKVGIVWGNGVVWGGGDAGVLWLGCGVAVVWGSGDGVRVIWIGGA